jgi:hypothetical protein
MERCSYFIQNKALFGSFPSQETVLHLEEQGVRCFIDLTDSDESKTTPYVTKYRYIKYPIVDRKIPQDWKSFAQLVVKICQVIHNLGEGEKVYVHCKGGHGRSGIMVACIFCHYYGLNPDEALRQTSKCHSNRPQMREKWRKLGSPQGKRQKDFVHRFFRPLRFIKAEMTGYTMGMHNLSSHSVSIPNIGTFPNAQLAFQYFRDPHNKEYVENLLNGKYCQELLKEHNRDWEENKVDYMYKVLQYKFSQHGDIRQNLLNTGLRPLVKISHDIFWGDGGNNQGKNIQGKLLNKLRRELLLEEFDQVYK